MQRKKQAPLLNVCMTSKDLKVRKRISHKISQAEAQKDDLNETQQSFIKIEKDADILTQDKNQTTFQSSVMEQEIEGDLWHKNQIQDQIIRESLNQNQILRQRVIELQSLLIQATSQINNLTEEIEEIRVKDKYIYISIFILKDLGTLRTTKLFDLNCKEQLSFLLGSLIN